MKLDHPRTQITALQDIPNIGKACIADLKLLGIHSPQQLIGRDPYHMYDELCRLTASHHDPCVYDVFISAVRFMEGAPGVPWWNYTAERKAHLLAVSTATKLG